MAPTIFIVMLLLLALCQAPCCCHGQSIKVTDLNKIVTKNPTQLHTVNSISQKKGSAAESIVAKDSNKEHTTGSKGVIDENAGDSEDDINDQFDEQTYVPSLNAARMTDNDDETRELPGNTDVSDPNRISRDKANNNQARPPSVQGQPRDSQLSSPVEREEEKLRNATVKLVMWLRNRLRKRLEEVATLEKEMETETILLESLQNNITDTASARKDEIRMKIKAQKRLTDFRRNTEEPERQLLLVQSQTKTLSDKMAQLGEIYNSLAEKHRMIREKLHAAGFSHWLEARGKEYMPRTAVGVLSKSVELFEPLSQGLGKAVNLDQNIAYGVESIVPIARNNIIVKVFEDVLMLIPIIPVFVVICKLVQTMHKLSVLHIVMYIATAFCAESVLLLLVSLCLGREPLQATQESHECLLITGLFINLILFVVYIFIQGLIAVLRSSRVEILQTVLAVAIGYHCYQTVFRPAVISEKINTTGVGYMMYIINFSLVIYEKKKTLNVQTPYEEEINELLLCVESWFWETVDAIRNVFHDRQQEVDSCSEGTSDLCPSEFSLMNGHDEMQKGGGPQSINDMKGGVLPMRGRRNYERWARAKIMTNSRHFHSNLFGVTNNTDTRRAENTTSFESQRGNIPMSKSDCSSLYGSCKE